MLVPWKGCALTAQCCHLISVLHYLPIFTANVFKNTSSMLLQYLDSTVHYLLAVMAILFKTTSSMLLPQRCCALPTCLCSQHIWKLQFLLNSAVHYLLIFTASHMLLCTTYEFFQLMYLKPPALICYCNSAVHYLLALLPSFRKLPDHSYLSIAVHYLLAFTW